MSPGFSGGVHPPENKHTENHAIEVMPAPRRVFIPFSQHAGKPARPLVKKDEMVRIGTMIGEADGLISASVHSSIAGKVIGLDDYFHPVLGSASCCVIESVNGDEWEEGIKEKHDYRALDKKQMLEIIRNAGIVGMGGAAFPTHVKLSPPGDKKIDTLIINGCECEPMLTGDHRLMLEYPAGIAEGARIFQRILGAGKLIFGIEDNKRDAVRAFAAEGMEVTVLRTKYPQGAEKQLIRAILNREVPRAGLPCGSECRNLLRGFSGAAVSQAVDRPCVNRRRRRGERTQKFTGAHRHAGAGNNQFLRRLYRATGADRIRRSDDGASPIRRECPGDQRHIRNTGLERAPAPG